MLDVLEGFFIAFPLRLFFGFSSHLFPLKKLIEDLLPFNLESPGRAAPVGNINTALAVDAPLEKHHLGIVSQVLGALNDQTVFLGSDRTENTDAYDALLAVGPVILQTPQDTEVLGGQVEFAPHVVLDRLGELPDLALII
jgi:hypothetical protein